MMLPISSLPDTGDGADQPTARAKGGLLELGFLPYTVFAQAANDRAETRRFAPDLPFAAELARRVKGDAQRCRQSLTRWCELAIR